MNTSSVASSSPPIDIRLSEESITRLNTKDVDIEIVTNPKATAKEFTWSRSLFVTRGPTNSVEVHSSRAPDYIFTQIPLIGGFTAELCCGTGYEGQTAGLVQPENSGALFRFSQQENRIFGVLASLNVIENWFGRHVPKSLRKLLDGAGQKTFHRPGPPPTYLKQTLHAALQNSTPMRHLLIDAAAVQIMGHQLETLCGEAPKSATPFEIHAVREAHAILQETADNPPTSSSLAQLCGISARQLEVVYREHFGVSLHKGIQQLRFQAACAALLRGEPAKAVAHRFGYANVSNFTFAFRRQVGLPPRKWLDQHRRHQSSL